LKYCPNPKKLIWERWKKKTKKNCRSKSDPW